MAKFTDISPWPRGRGVSGRRRRDRPRGGTRNLGQRDYASWYPSKRKGRRVLGSSHRSEAREKAKSLLPPSGGPTQVRTTPRVVFRALLRSGQTAVLEVAH